MTFDEIFQNYVAQGFTKPTAGVSGIETLMPTTAIPISPVPTIQQPQQTGGGRDDDFTNVPDTTTNLGITSFSDAIQQMQDLYSQLPTPTNLAIRAAQGIGNLIQNYGNQYTNITGALKPEVQEAIQMDTVREMARENERSGGGGYQAGFDGGFKGGSGSASEMGSF